MSDSEIVTKLDSDIIHAVHTVTGLVSEIPRIWLSLFPFRELAAGELADLRAGVASPVTAPEVPAVPVELPTVPAPVEEGLSNA
jgi:hypothetical protein